MAKKIGATMMWEKNKETKNAVAVFKKDGDQAYFLELEKEHTAKEAGIYVVVETNENGVHTGNAVVIRSVLTKEFLDYFFYAANCYGIPTLSETIPFLKKKDVNLQVSKADATNWKRPKEKNTH